MPISIRGIKESAGDVTSTSAPVREQPTLLSAIAGPEVKPENNNGLDELHEQANLAAKFGAKVTITGAWVWAGFDHIPASEIRQALKDNKWIWCKGKGKWAWRGKPSHSHKQMSWEYITSKYGEENIEGGNNNG
jgi:hypothetical protein